MMAAGRMRRGLDSECVFKAKPTGFANEANQHVREGVKGDSQALGLRFRKDGHFPRTVGRAGVGVGDQKCGPGCAVRQPSGGTVEWQDPWIWRDLGSRYKLENCELEVDIESHQSEQDHLGVLP